MRRSAIILSLSCCLLAGGGIVSLAPSQARAQGAGPPAAYKTHPEHTVRSPDGKTIIEQYAKENADGDYTWQFWARREDKRTLLGPEQPDYPAGFRFTKDSRWVVRMQKTGAGASSLYLYRLGPHGFAAATAKPLDDLAWAYFMTHPDGKKLGMPDYHIAAGLVKGTEENYRWMGVQWPDSRYLVVYLSGQLSPDHRHPRVRSLYGWHCRYDLVKGTFDVPPEFATNNAKAVAPDAR